MIEVWFVRHGQTDWNLERRVQGWTDVPLNQTGVRQAQLLADALHGIPFHSIYTSDLSRAKTTATILQAQLGSPLHVDARLRERHFGRAEGTFRLEGVAHSGEIKRIALASSPVVRHDEANDGREPDVEVQRRANSFLSTLVTRHQEGRILCVSHGGLIRAILDALGWLDDGGLQNTSVSQLTWNGREWHVDCVNGATHLKNESV